MLIPIDYYSIENNKKYLFFPEILNTSLDDIIIDNDTNVIFFGENFNQSLDNVILPHSIQSIYFGFEFNQPLNNVKFPEFLLNLSLPGKFNQPINGLEIFNKIESLELGYFFNQSFDNLYFPNIKHITISNNHATNILLKFPNLISIKLNLGINIPLNKINMPNTVERICYEDSTTSSIFDLNNMVFPQNLKILKLPSEYGVITDNERLHYLRNGLIIWKLGNLPEGLEELTAFYYDTENVNLPTSLTKFITKTQNNSLNVPFGCKIENIAKNIERNYN